MMFLNSILLLLLIGICVLLVICILCWFLLFMQLQVLFLLCMNGCIEFWDLENRYLLFVLWLLSRFSNLFLCWCNLLVSDFLLLEFSVLLLVWLVILWMCWRMLLIEWRMVFFWFRLFFVLVMLVLYCLFNFCFWFRCNRCIELIGLFVGVRMCLLVLICLKVWFRFVQLWEILLIELLKVWMVEMCMVVVLLVQVLLREFNGMF